MSMYYETEKNLNVCMYIQFIKRFKKCLCGDIFRQLGTSNRIVIIMNNNYYFLNCLNFVCCSESSEKLSGAHFFRFVLTAQLLLKSGGLCRT
jgi:hypothetical protein